MSEPELHSPSEGPPVDQLSDLAPASRGRQLYKFGLIGTGALMAWFALKSPYEDVILTTLGLAMIGFAVLPALLWARDNRPWFPAFETYLGTTLVFQALPFLSRADLSLEFSQETIQQSAIDVLAFQVVALLVFRQTRGRPARNPVLITPVVPRYLGVLSSWGVWLNIAYILAETFTKIIPWELLGSTRALAFGICLVAAFMQSWNWGQGRLSTGERLGFASAVILQCVLGASSFRLVSVMTLLGMILMAYIAASRRLPLVVIAIVLPLVAILHHGKYEMRKLYWARNAQPLTIDKIPERYVEWFQYGLQFGTDFDDETLRLNGQSDPSLLERASLFQMLALVVANVPQPEPYLGGESYVDIPAVLIPRFLWPDKPSSLDANTRLALHFRLVDQETAQNVSIAFGPIAEAHANFGFLGVVGLAAAMGYGFKRACMLATGAPLFSVVGLFVILLGAWSCQAELIMATWLASLFQAAVVVVGGPLLMRRLLAS